jgi:ribosomal protein L16 Arg81 hydroxylase
MAIEQLLKSVSRAQFMGDYFLRLPYIEAGGASAFEQLGSWNMVDWLLRQPKVDVLAGRRGEVWSGDDPATAGAARQLLAEGYTVGIRHAERHGGQLAALAAEFQAEFAAEVNIHLYCTPGGQPGFGWHYDAEDVFILQTTGSKQWSLRKNTVNPWPLIETIPQDMRYGRELMPLQRTNLAAGDWLYIPAGYWHCTEAGEESISLSIGLMSPTAIDLYDFLRNRLLQSIRWRQRLPTPGKAGPWSDEQLLAMYQEVLAGLSSDLKREMNDTLLREFIEARRRASGVERDADV